MNYKLILAEKPGIQPVLVQKMSLRNKILLQKAYVIYQEKGHTDFRQISQVECTAESQELPLAVPRTVPVSLSCPLAVLERR